jgi:hypothetical protein
MPRPRPNQLHDDLDALIDGRPVELTEELAPLVEAAGSLRAELAAFELDPKIADQHLEMVLRSATVVQLPQRQQVNNWDLRRRVAAVALAAALVLAPATMASAAALPGQAMYPFKLAIEHLRVASVQWSPAREAGERTRVADVRLDELERLVDLRMFSQVPTAIKALNRAVLAAGVAVAEAREDGASVGAVAAKLARVKGKGTAVVTMAGSTVEQPSLTLGGDTRAEVRAAVAESLGGVLAPSGQPGGTTATTAPTTAPNPTQGPASTNPPSEPTQPTVTSPGAVPSTSPEPPTTDSPTTTSPPPTDPPTTDTTAPPGSGGDPTGGSEPGVAGRTGEELPAPSGETP